MKIGNHWNGFLTCAMNYPVSLEIFKSWLAFFPPESHTFVKLQLLEQSQEFIYSAESTSTGSLALQTRQAPFWGGICGSKVAQGQHRTVVGKVQCSSHLPFHVTPKRRLRGFCLAPLILLGVSGR